LETQFLSDRKMRDTIEVGAFHVGLLT